MMPSDRRTVLLVHRMPDGTVHEDWMLERDSTDERRLVTFRLATGQLQRAIAMLRGGAHKTRIIIQADRIPDHRARYLDFQGEIRDGLGRVDRIAAGSVVIHSLTPDLIEARIGFDTAPVLVVAGAAVADELWRLELRVADG